jgi:hypothetical protein
MSARRILIKAIGGIYHWMHLWLPVVVIFALVGWCS